MFVSPFHLPETRSHAQVVVLDTETGSLISSEAFEGLEEARNRVAYALSDDGSKVLVYVTDTCYVANW